MTISPDLDRSRLLIIDDDPHLLRLLEMALQNERYEIRTAQSGQRGLETMATYHPDLIILDVMMPNMDGIEVLRRIRAASDIPVIMLTAKSEVRDRIQGLSFGADDYILKPFNLEELILRIGAVLRRFRQKETTDSQCYDDGILHINYRTLEVEKNGNVIVLSHTEALIVCYLARRAGRFVTATELLRGIWGDGFGDRAHYARVYIYNLRKALEDDPDKPHYITSSRGRGYRFQPATR
ncbi:MAG: response regulator transcription factor [Chloroflexi bacterium]|nr:response regulator transcription factor [Chloroflexota bacterium]